MKIYRMTSKSVPRYVIPQYLGKANLAKKVRNLHCVDLARYIDYHNTSDLSTVAYLDRLGVEITRYLNVISNRVRF